MSQSHAPAHADFSESAIPAHWDCLPKREVQRAPRATGIPAAFPAPGDFAWLMPLLFLFARMNGASGLLGDGDTGWHIRTGEWILTHGKIPATDPFSFTRPGQPWFAWEWLSDVVMGALHQIGGMQAVLLGAMLLICLTFFLLYRLVLRQSGSVLLAFTLTTVAAGGAAIHWLARPHLFTMLFVVIFGSVLESRKSRMMFLLPAISLLWTNLHGGFIAGLLLTGAYAGGEALTFLLSRDGARKQEARKHFRMYAATTLGCFAVSFANPWGWELHRHLITFLTTPAYFRNIAEFLSISFRHPLAPFFELMLVLGLFTAFWNLGKGTFTPALLLLGWAHLALLSVRNVPLFLLIAAPHVGAALSSWLGNLEGTTEGTPLRWANVAFNSLSLRLNRADEGKHWYITGPLCLVLLGRAMYAPAPPPLFRAAYAPARYPEAALSVLQPRDRIFTSDSWGGYLIYQRYPARVFVDGRSDFYGPDFEKQYFDTIGGKYNWQNALQAYGVDTVVLPVETPLASLLKASPRWRSVFDDGMAIVFRANDSPGGASR